jgi:putative heme-binding domain-containing protein
MLRCLHNKAALVLSFSTFSLFAADPFAEFVRSADPKDPEQELKSFHLPPGFEAQLVAAEPDIGKPMNMAFDARGRLWITQSREYPYAAPPEKPARDAIKVLSDFAEDGRARSIVTFAEGLNIPIGLHPYQDGVIAFSIPYIHSFRDTDGDGKSDKQERILGRLGFEKDTHGLTGAFRRGYDGWIYADHGFNNDSTITASDGSSIKLNSGNTYRFRPDGSRVEQFTWGQVNPFGLMFDGRGDLWSADCHSSPVYLLLRGAYYPSFGKPDDGLGHGPAVMRHSHGSTAISGIVVYDAEDFPQEYRGNTFVGNVMTCRINRDSYEWHGSTPKAKEEPDLLRSEDSWFRPVDLQLGPDGALYVADFYNRIIGHYEVALDHPGRDRERGRIWRIVYRGPGADSANRARITPSSKELPDLRSGTADDWIAELAHPNITRRMLAMSELSDRMKWAAIPSLMKAVAASTNAPQKANAAWALHRLKNLDEATVVQLARDASAHVRLHAMRILAETRELSESALQAARAASSDPDAFVQRAAADALGTHPAAENIPLLLKLRRQVPEKDENLLHVTRMALRNQLRDTENGFAGVAEMRLDEVDSSTIADVAVAVPSPVAGSFLLEHVQRTREPREKLSRYLRHVAHHIPESKFDTLADYVRKQFGDDTDLQLTLFKSVQEGAAQRGAKLTETMRNWGRDLAAILLEADDQKSDWTHLPFPGAVDTKNPWFMQRRASSDGNSNARFLCSLPPGGEQLTGILRSKAFSIPPKLNFFLAGHDGFPDKAPQKKNVVRLRLAETDEVIAEKYPPRNDTAQAVSWSLEEHTGKRGYVEIVDGDTGSAYAWLAIGRFEPAVVTIPRTDPRTIAEKLQAGANLARELALYNFAPQLKRILLDGTTDVQTRAASAAALVSFKPNDVIAALVSLIAEASIPSELREKTCRSAAEQDVAVAESALVEALRFSPRRVQSKLAQNLASSVNGAETLLRLITANKVPATLLADRSVRERFGAHKNGSIDKRVEELTRELPPPNEAFDKMVTKRRRAYDATKASSARGTELFMQHCAACHQLSGHGAIVGPQLDGVGNRGLERLAEDILDPNRSVDPAFRSTLLVLKDGDVISGLFRRQEAELLVLADSAGKELTVSKSSVAERRESGTSLMPDNFGELLSQEQFNDLVAFLLSSGAHASK